MGALGLLDRYYCIKIGKQNKLIMTSIRINTSKKAIRAVQLGFKPRGKDEIRTEQTPRSTFDCLTNSFPTEHDADQEIMLI